MNRGVKLFLALLSAETTAAAAAALVWAWRAGVLGQGDTRERLLPLFLVVFPVLMWGILAWAPRRLASTQPRLSDDHRRHLQGALSFWFLVLAAAQGWLIYQYIGGPPVLDRENFARLAAILMGVAMAVRGNFFAKVSPPTGEAAPDPGVWTRASLRTGWGMALLGGGLVACAVILPVRWLVVAMLATAPVLIWLSLSQQRAMRSRTGGSR